MKTGRAAVILQARMASRRLPGKALEVVGGRPIVEQCLRRLVAANVGAVILATTRRPEDDALVAIARRAGLSSFRGATDDVLGRFVACAAQFGIDIIVRATADNPGVDIRAAARLVRAFRETNVDYVREDDLPYGAAVEVVSSHALTTAANLVTAAADREHVTTFVRRRSDLFSVLDLPAPAALARPDVRLTVDTPADLHHVRELYRRTGRDMPSLTELIAASDRLSRQSVA
jgi:spore coat polysaccharide biosynthesis protein SpsF